MVCTFDGDGPLVSFMHATNDTSRRSNGSRQGRNEKKKGRTGKKILFREWCAFGFVTLRSETVFIAAVVWCLQTLVTCLPMTNKSSKKKKVSFLCHCVGCESARRRRQDLHRRGLVGFPGVPKNMTVPTTDSSQNRGWRVGFGGLKGVVRLFERPHSLRCLSRRKKNFHHSGATAAT